MRVRASRPSFWVGQTYDKWDGQSWMQSADPANGDRRDQAAVRIPVRHPPGP